MDIAGGHVVGHVGARGTRSITVSLGGRMLDTDAIAADASIATAVKSAICALTREARAF